METFLSYSVNLSSTFHLGGVEKFAYWDISSLLSSKRKVRVEYAPPESQYETVHTQNLDSFLLVPTQQGFLLLLVEKNDQSGDRIFCIPGIISDQSVSRATIPDAIRSDGTLLIRGEIFWLKTTCTSSTDVFTWKIWAFDVFDEE